MIAEKTEKTYLVASSVKEAIQMARSNQGDFKFIAGGTDLMANRFQETEASPCLIDISGIPELKKVESRGGYLYLGPLIQLESLKNITEIKKEFPVVMEAAKSVASPLIRKVATIGGNLLCENRCIYYNQSEWWRESAGFCLKCGGDACIATGGTKACFSEIVSDMAPALISLEAEIEIEGFKGARRIQLEELYSGDGVNPRTIKEEELITGIFLPLSRGFKTVFKKLRLRQSLEFTSLTTSVSVDSAENLRIALGGVDPKVILVTDRMGEDEDNMVKNAMKKARAIDNDMFTRTYRKEMIGVFLSQSFEELKNQRIKAQGNQDTR